MKRKEKRRVDWKIIIGILAVVILAVFVFSNLGNKLIGLLIIDNDAKSSEPGVIYQVYHQQCRKEEGYFEDISKAAYLEVNNIFIREYKRMSLHCDTDDIRNLTIEEFEDLDINCECSERNRRKCQKDWEFKKGFCWEENKFTNPLKACSWYICENNYFVEVYWPERQDIKAKIKILPGV